MEFPSALVSGGRSNLNEDVKDQEKELNSLRNLPVTTEDISADQPPVNT